VNSDVAVFEIDTTQEGVIKQLRNCPDLPSGVTIKDEIPESLYLRIKNHFDYVRTVFGSWVTPAILKKAGITSEELFEREMTQWETKKPAWLALVIGLYNRYTVSNRFVPHLDTYLAFLGKQYGKTVESWGTVQQQCDGWDGLTKEQAIYKLNSTLSLYEKMHDGSTDIPQSLDSIREYTCLSLFDVPEFQINTNVTINLEDLLMAAQISAFRHQSLVVKRNAMMAKRIETLITENPDKSFFFAFGGDHFVGETSILHQLALPGFKIARQPATFQINGKKED